VGTLRQKLEDVKRASGVSLQRFKQQVAHAGVPEPAQNQEQAQEQQQQQEQAQGQQQEQQQQQSAAERSDDISKGVASGDASSSDAKGSGARELDSRICSCLVQKM